MIFMPEYDFIYSAFDFPNFDTCFYFLLCFSYNFQQPAEVIAFNTLIHIFEFTLI